MGEKGEGDGRKACQIGKNGEKIGQEHINGILAFLPEPEGGEGNRGHEKKVVVPENFVCLIDNQSSNFLGLGEIGVKVPGAQHKIAQHDAAFDLPAKIGRPVLGVEGC
jgi:hypothetical protein